MSQLKKENRKKESLRQKFNLAIPRKRGRLSPSAKMVLEEHSERYREALRRGEKCLELETRVFGGSALPDEPGGDNFFTEILE